MKKFNSKQEIFDYIVDKFGKNAKTILTRGSVAKEPAKSFSDFNIEVYSKTKYPIYEIHLVRGLPIIIVVNFYNYKFGSLLSLPTNVKMLKGNYTTGIEESFEKAINTKRIYNKDEIVIRNYQLLLELFFKFMRTGNQEYIDVIQEQIDFRNLPKKEENNE